MHRRPRRSAQRQVSGRRHRVSSPARPRPSVAGGRGTTMPSRQALVMLAAAPIRSIADNARRRVVVVDAFVIDAFVMA